MAKLESLFMFLPELRTLSEVIVITIGVQYKESGIVTGVVTDVTGGREY
jgi:hypothetical protein